ncbi:uncharacterized protein LOC100204652 isoform X2 [Hydra vulgaris]|uniref:Uncharacterized protein LOC100204652 isoform X2 n=1 Tax=Hydra vulgaris TaxID=6087 RepID=A0ABM4BEB5_HYDVU
MLTILACMIVVAYAGREPYLGEDIDILIQKSKRSGVTAVPREIPITEEQKQDYEHYNTKFAEIAKAYAEGYKAAIKAVQARAIIAQKRLQQMQVNNVRSTIPEVPERGKTERLETSLFSFPPTNEVTENGIEKSEIPHPVNNEHRVFERSTNLLKGKENFGEETAFDYQKDAIAHAAGLSETVENNFQQEKKKRSTDEPKISRHRRSRMPYLGQNLDALGVVRAKPNWEKPVKKSIPQVSNANALFSNGYLSPQQYPMYMQPPPAQQQLLPEPYQQQRAFFRSYPSSYSPLVQRQAMNNFFSAPQSPQIRSYINSAMYPSFPFQNYGKVVSNQPSDVETTRRNEEVVQKKRSASPEPSIGGGSAVLSRQDIIYKN